MATKQEFDELNEKIFECLRRVENARTEADMRTAFEEYRLLREHYFTLVSAE